MDGRKVRGRKRSQEIFHPSGQSPDEARKEMSGRVLSAEGWGAGIKQQAIRLWATGPYSITFEPLSFYLPLLSIFTSFPQPPPPVLIIPRVIQYQHLILLWFHRLPGDLSCVSLPGLQWCRPHKVTELASIRWNLKPSSCPSSTPPLQPNHSTCFSAFSVTQLSPLFTNHTYFQGLKDIKCNFSVILLRACYLKSETKTKINFSSYFLESKAYFSQLFQRKKTNNQKKTVLKLETVLIQSSSDIYILSWPLMERLHVDGMIVGIKDWCTCFKCSFDVNLLASFSDEFNRLGATFWKVKSAERGEGRRWSRDSHT